MEHPFDQIALDGYPVLVVGATAAADGSAREILRRGGLVTHICHGGKGLGADAAMLPDRLVLERPFRPSDARGKALVVAASCDAKIDSHVAEVARAAGIPLIVACRPAGAGYEQVATSGPNRAAAAYMAGAA